MEKLISILGMIPVAGLVLTYVAAGDKSMAQFIKQDVIRRVPRGQCRKCNAAALERFTLCQSHLSEALNN